MCKRLTEPLPPGYHAIRLPGSGWAVLQEVRDEAGRLLDLARLSIPDPATGHLVLALYSGPMAASRAAHRDELRRLRTELVAMQQALRKMPVDEPQPAAL